MAFVAVYDACVMYPAPLRDVLLRLAGTNLFRARWTDRINDEWINALLRKRPELECDRLRRTKDLINQAVEDCLIAGYESLISSLTLPDDNDRHVLAAAIVGRANVIVTFNLSDFPADILNPFEIEAQHPDTFIRHVLDLDPLALAAIRDCRAALKSPPKNVADFLATLSRQGLPETVSYLSEWKELI